MIRIPERRGRTDILQPTQQLCQLVIGEARALASRGWDIDAPTALAYEEYGLDVCHNATENRLEYTDTNDDVVALDLRNGTLIRL